MPTNYLTTDSDLTSVANAIRAKSGGSGQLAFPAGFVSEIGNIPSGGGGDTLEIKGVAIVSLAYQSGLPTKVKISSDFLGTVTLQQTGDAIFANNVLIKEVELTGSAVSAGLTVRGDFRNNAVYAFEKINFNFLPIHNMDVFDFVYGTNKNPNFKSMLGLNFIKTGGSNYCVRAWNNLGALENVTVKPNTFGQLDLKGQTYNNLGFAASSLLTDTSLCQIANGLCATYTSKLTLHATPKARCSTLMGTVSQVTDDTGTYDFFTQDANGTVSLADFITTTKGWTLA